MNPTEPNRQLIIAVLHLAVVDAMDKPETKTGIPRLSNKARSAFEFFDSGTFETYAESINIDPDAFRSRLNRLMMRGDGSSDSSKRSYHDVQVKRQAYCMNRKLWGEKWKEHLA